MYPKLVKTSVRKSIFVNQLWFTHISPVAMHEWNVKYQIESEPISAESRLKIAPQSLQRTLKILLCAGLIFLQSQVVYLIRCTIAIAILQLSIATYAKAEPKPEQLSNAARDFLDSGEYYNAYESATQALEEIVREVGEGSSKTLRARSLRAEALINLEYVDEALTEIDNALAIINREPNTYSYEYVQIITIQGMAFLSIQDFGKAEDTFRLALETYSSVGTKDPNVAWLANLGLALTLSNMERVKESIPFYWSAYRAMSEVEESISEDKRMLVLLLGAESMDSASLRNEEVKFREEIVKIIERSSEAESEDMLSALFFLTFAYNFADRDAEVKTTGYRQLALAERLYGSESLRTAEVLDGLADLFHWRLGDEAGVALKQRADRIREKVEVTQVAEAEAMLQNEKTQLEKDIAKLNTDKEPASKETYRKRLELYKRARELGQFDLAILMAKEIVKVNEELVGSADLQMYPPLRYLAEAYEDNEDIDDALRVRGQIRDLLDGHDGSSKIQLHRSMGHELQLLEKKGDRDGVAKLMSKLAKSKLDLLEAYYAHAPSILKPVNDDVLLDALMLRFFTEKQRTSDVAERLLKEGKSIYLDSAGQNTKALFKAEATVLAAAELYYEIYSAEVPEYIEALVLLSDIYTQYVIDRDLQTQSDEQIEFLQSILIRVYQYKIAAQDAKGTEDALKYLRLVYQLPAGKAQLDKDSGRALRILEAGIKTFDDITPLEGRHYWELAESYARQLARMRRASDATSFVDAKLDAVLTRYPEDHPDKVRAFATAGRISSKLRGEAEPASLSDFYFSLVQSAIELDKLEFAAEVLKDMSPLIREIFSESLINKFLERRKTSAALEIASNMTPGINRNIELTKVSIEAANQIDEKVLSEALDQFEPHSRDYQKAALVVAHALAEINQPAASRRYLEKGLPASNVLPAASELESYENSDIATRLLMAADTFVSIGKRERGVNLMTKAIAYEEKGLNSDSYQWRSFKLKLTGVQARLGYFDDAIKTAKVIGKYDIEAAQAWTAIIIAAHRKEDEAILQSVIDSLFRWIEDIPQTESSSLVLWLVIYIGEAANFDLINKIAPRFTDKQQIQLLTTTALRLQQEGTPKQAELLVERALEVLRNYDELEISVINKLPEALITMKKPDKALSLSRHVTNSWYRFQIAADAIDAGASVKGVQLDSEINEAYQAIYARHAERSEPAPNLLCTDLLRFSHYVVKYDRARALAAVDEVRDHCQAIFDGTPDSDNIFSARRTLMIDLALVDKELGHTTHYDQAINQLQKEALQQVNFKSRVSALSYLISDLHLNDQTAAAESTFKQLQRMEKDFDCMNEQPPKLLHSALSVAEQTEIAYTEEVLDIHKDLVEHLEKIGCMDLAIEWAKQSVSLQESINPLANDIDLIAYSVNKIYFRDLEQLLYRLYRDKGRYNDLVDMILKRADEMNTLVPEIISYGSAYTDHPRGLAIESPREWSGTMTWRPKLRLHQAATALNHKKLLEANRNELIEQGETRWVDLFASEFEDHLNVIANVISNENQNNESLIDEAFQVSQLMRQTRVSSSLNEMALRKSLNGTPSGDAATNFNRNRRAMFDLRRKIKAEIFTNGAESVRAEIEQLAILEAESQRLQQLMRDHDPLFSTLTDPVPVTLKEIQALIKPNEGLILFLLGQHHSYVSVVRRETAVFEKIDVTEKSVAAAIMELRRGLSLDYSALATGVQNFDAETAYDLYKALFAPIQEYIANVEHLLIIPDGALALVSPGVFLRSPPEDKIKHLSDFANLRWLAHEYAISIIPAVSSLRALRIYAKPTSATKEFLGIGDPVLNGHEDLTALQGSARLSAKTQSVMLLGAIANSDDELKEMSSLFGKNQSKLLLGLEATERAVRALSSLSEYRIVAFSTHGLLANENEIVDEPALVLTPNTTRNALDDDGIITASEINTLTFDAELIILSACNTAAPDDSGNGEGLSGLASSFFVAGGRTLLVSHWPVGSRASKAMTLEMLRTWQNDSNIGIAEAHRQSILFMTGKLSSSVSEHRPYFAHPAFWGAFIIVGDGGASN